MKFSNSLKFNAVSEWLEEYINYSALKKKMYELSQQYDSHTSAARSGTAAERAGLLSTPADACNLQFIPMLDAELEKIIAFYHSQVKEVQDELDEIQIMVEQQEERGLMPAYRDDDDDDDEDEDDDDEANTNESGKSSPRRKRRKSMDGRPALSERSSNGGRRLSTDSYDYDMEASVPSMRRSGYLPEQDPSTRGHSMSPHSALTPLATMFRFVRGGGSTDDGQETIWNSRADFARDTRIVYKRRLTTLYLTATSLRSYVELNQTGFRKVLKKYDKVTQNELKDSYMHEKVEPATPFTIDSKDKLNSIITGIITLYAKCVTRGDMSAATRQLKIHQREHIVWERDTVWKQMIGRERRGEGSGQMKTLGASASSVEEPLISVPTPVGRFKITSRGISLAVALTVFIGLLNSSVIDEEEANRCFSILCFCTVLWATEAIPLFVTSMIVPFLVVILRVTRTEGTDEQPPIRMSTHDATRYIFSIMFSPTIMLLIGGFTIASALSKTNIDRIIITRVLSLAGTRPSIVLLAFMLVSCFAR
ncbi:low-affinity phosphate transporter [Tulasnella sp. JGI-2019a]|nr:low-affinity phosphate transporter [Tulasnella sp. JGI-2019a]KAG9013982.1 low-affinity phosphate transporter [Tulasnella sp. JGI-2019a]